MAASDLEDEDAAFRKLAAEFRRLLSLKERLANEEKLRAEQRAKAKEETRKQLAEVQRQVNLLRERYDVAPRPISDTKAQSLCEACSSSLTVSRGTQQPEGIISKTTVLLSKGTSTEDRQTTKAASLVDELDLIGQRLSGLGSQIDGVSRKTAGMMRRSGSTLCLLRSQH